MTDNTAPTIHDKRCPANHAGEAACNCGYGVPDGAHAFKNFHKNLCKRFGYTHDEVYWWRDLVSLEEHIAKLTNPDVEAAGQVEALDKANHALRRQVADLQREAGTWNAALTEVTKRQWEPRTKPVGDDLPRKLLEACRRDALSWDDRAHIGRAIARIQGGGARGPIPFAGIDPNFAPGSNPENPQTEPSMSEKERRRRDAFDSLPDDYEVN